MADTETLHPSDYFDGFHTNADENPYASKEFSLQEKLSKIQSVWNEIVKNPGMLTDISERNILFAAGGGLVKQFGKNESRIWSHIIDASDQGNISIASIDFTTDELALMGEFYRSLEMNEHCIDERLVADTDHLDHEVHCKCGACAAIGVATNKDDIEDQLLKELDQDVKQDVYQDMPDHESMVILVDLHGADVVLGEKREELKQTGALAFNASIPLEKVSNWADGDDEKAKNLISILVKWNVQIARNIIGGGHNKHQDLADQTLIVLDKRKIESSELMNHTLQELSKVEHGEILEIAA